MKKKTFKNLEPREHILLRPNMYIGATNVVEEDMWIFDKRENRFKHMKIKHVPGITKIINEILDNSIDNYIDTNGKYSTNISVTIEKDFTITVKDNGTGIPVEKNNDGLLIPFMCFGKPMAGSNFDDDQRTGAGMNGIGAFACNVFSKSFFVRTVDLEGRRYEAKWENNGLLVDEKVGKKNHYSRGTEVRFQIDLSKFDTTGMEEKELLITLYKLIEQRMINIAALYNITFTLNGNKIAIKNPKEFVSYFGDEDKIVLYQSDKYFIAILANEEDDFQFHTYVNSLYLKKGGTHIDLITNEVVKRLRSKLERKYKNIKPGDIKNKLFVIAFFKDFPKYKTDSQTKEILTNSVSEIRKYLGEQFSFDKFADKVYKNKNIIEEITLRYRIAQELEERKALKKATSRKRRDIPKYWKPSKENKYFIVTEGDSAVGAIIAAIDRTDKGYFPLKGKIINSIKQPLSKIAKNEEIVNMSEILGIDLSDPKINDVQFEKMVFAADADTDGQSIISLLLAYVYRFIPEMILQGRVAILKTPIVITYKGKKIDQFIFDFQELYEKESRGEFNNVKVQYKKGLGAIYENEWTELFKRYSFEDLLQTVTVQDAEREFKLLELWMDEDRDFRKEMVMNEIKNFDINRV